MLDLYHATRDDLILDLRDTLADWVRQLTALTPEQAEMRRVIAHLTSQVGALAEQAVRDDEPPRGTPRGMLGLKRTEATGRAARPRTQRAQGFARRRMPTTAQSRMPWRLVPIAGPRLPRQC